MRFHHICLPCSLGVIYRCIMASLTFVNLLLVTIWNFTVNQCGFQHIYFTYLHKADLSVQNSLKPFFMVGLCPLWQTGCTRRSFLCAGGWKNEVESRNGSFYRWFQTTVFHKPFGLCRMFRTDCHVRRWIRFCRSPTWTSIKGKIVTTDSRSSPDITWFGVSLLRDKTPCVW